MSASETLETEAVHLLIMIVQIIERYHNIYWLGYWLHFTSIVASKLHRQSVAFKVSLR
jgi:hypothetical protein